ncbi:MAG: acyl-CoA dehydrogenase [Myxococcales bacterium]|nr:acyl-CoA dehydrogenase [Myxococcales bacterium]MCB9709403.1 acyl-CoA dehydrogenase [Myxococcales bacterium]
MDTSLTDEQRLIQDTVREFAEREVAPRAKQLDAESMWPAALIDGLAKLGLMGMTVPEAWGGSGVDHISYAIAVEEISRACASLGVIMSVNNSLACAPLAAHGTDAQKEKYLKPLASGEKLGCFGLTEPASGSDASHMETVAHKDGDGWVISGSKNWITNGPHADVIIVFAATDRQAGPRGITAFVVSTDAKGFGRETPDSKLGIHAAHSCTVFFDQCRIPTTHQLGEEGEGFKIAMATLDGGRIGIAAQALGIARAAFEKARDYAKERKAFGEPIANKQAIQFMLADMATEIEAARLLVQRAAWLKDQGQRHTSEAAVAKLFASEMATRVSHKALQIHGGYGYSTDYDVERHYRDARITEIYEGTSEIMRIVIAARALRE